MASIEELLREHLRRQRSKAFQKFKPRRWQERWLNSKRKMVVALCANQVGKSTTIAYKASMTARCVYPDWYTGVRIEDRAPVIFVVGLTSEEVRDSIQTKLIGPNIDDPGGGMIPPEDIIKITKRANVPGSADTIFVKHPLGQAQICLKTAEQGRERLQGATVDLVIIDEEPPRDVLNELVARTAKANGQLCIGFTALKGMSEVYIFLTEQPDDVVEIVHAGWNQEDAPHLSDESIRVMREIYKDNPAELQARSTGIPTVGKGAIYPFPQEDYTGRQIKIRDHMRRLVAMDVGWTHPTAALIGAYDDDTDILYIYDEHCQEAKPPSYHASAIKRWGDYTIVMDTASLQTNKNDGTTLYGMYELEFDGPNWEEIPEDRRRVQLADNTAGSVMSGIAKTYQRFDEGRIYISENCVKLLEELKLYRYDEKTGKIVKKKDDLCLAGDNMVLTREFGWRRIDSLVGVEFEIMTPIGWCKAWNVHSKGVKACVKTTLGNGNHFTHTHDHKFILDGHGFSIATSDAMRYIVSKEIADGSHPTWSNQNGVQRDAFLQGEDVSLLHGDDGRGRPYQAMHAPSGRVGIPQWEDPGSVVVGSPYRREQGEQLNLKPAIDAWFRASGISHVRGRGSETGCEKADDRTGHPSRTSLAQVGTGESVAPDAREGFPPPTGGSDQACVREVWCRVPGECEAEEAEGVAHQVLLDEVQARGVEGSSEETDAGCGRLDGRDEAMRGVWRGLPDESPEHIQALFPPLHNEEVLLQEEIGDIEVYDLSVDVAHCFFLDSGVIASNCDAMRYMVMSIHLARLRGMRARNEDIIYKSSSTWAPVDETIGY